MTRATNGKISDSVRRSQALPLSWDVPGDAEVDDLKVRLWKLTELRRQPLSPVLLEGAILLVLCMQTGESVQASFNAFRGSSPSSLAPPLLLTFDEGKPLIIMRPTPDARPIHLPQTKLLTRLLDLLPPLSEPYDLLFNCSLADIKKEVSKLIRDNKNWRSRSPKAARSLIAHNRWLFRRMRDVSKGDPALIALLQPDRPAAEQTLTAYCAVPQSNLVRRYRSAIRPLGGVSPMPKSSEFEQTLVGRAKLPINDQLRQEILTVRRRLSRPMISPNSIEADKLLGPLPVTRNWHRAMMIYTYVLATFGTGQRGKKAPCGERAIDRESGFAWVVEKGNPKLGLAGERGVFHCRTVREQLERYEDYLNTLERMLQRRCGSLASELQTLRENNEQLLFFDIVNGKLSKLTPHALSKVARDDGWIHDAAMGRRWLRSQLTAELPSDSLAAQFGHNLDGLDVWSQHSGLQVKELPAILGPAIERALSSIGLEPSSPKPPKRRTKINKGPDTQTLHQCNRQRSGQLIASMIWHGALLQSDQHEAAFESLITFDQSLEPLPWILLDARHKRTNRWVVDPLTANLVKRYRDAGLPFYPAFKTAIKEYFGSNQKYEEFVTSAIRRWRFKLPPILHAKAIGKLNNHDLPNSQIKNGQSEIQYKDPWSESSLTLTGQNMIDWLEKVKQTQNYSKKANKYLLYRQLHTEVIQQLFWHEMPALERWLTLACIQLLVTDRGKENPAGYALYTIIEKAKCVFGHFANDDVGKYKNLALNDWPPDKIPQFLPLGRARNDVVAALVSLVQAYAHKDEEADIISNLMSSPENHLSFIVRSSLYHEMWGNEKDPMQRVALALCYRAGVRRDELSHLTKDMFAVDNDLITLRLDHRPNRKLKTFHSRRIIPLDVVMIKKERDELKKLLEEAEDRLFPSWKKTRGNLENAFKEVSQKEYVSELALRHSFATNAYAALLWPDFDQSKYANYFDPDLLSRRKALRIRLCGKSSLGAIGPHALATVMGHTSPSRTLFNYAHNLEFILAAHVATWQKAP